MADENHLEILREGVEVWNQWRKENPDIKPDLYDADFYKANLNGADLNGADLNGADLNGADLNGADS
ncbi:MAG: pentapeptide repeat-containing protein [Cyanobacteria bacterium P01_G01_bin.39]